MKGKTIAYKFVKWEVPEKPNTETTRLLEKATSNFNGLNKNEKNKIAEILYGLGGGSSSTYKLGGWAWPMSRYLPKILVKQHGNWQEYYAPDKTSLREALGGTIQEMVYA